MATMVVDSFATGYYKRSQIRKSLPVTDEEMTVEHVHVHVHGAMAEEGSVAEGLRNRVISQVSKIHLHNCKNLFFPKYECENKYKG